MKEADLCPQRVLQSFKHCFCAKEKSKKKRDPVIHIPNVSVPEVRPSGRAAACAAVQLAALNWLR
jgi:hypothetical protein